MGAKGLKSYQILVCKLWHWMMKQGTLNSSVFRELLLFSLFLCISLLGSADDVLAICEVKAFHTYALGDLCSCKTVLA